MSSILVVYVATLLILLGIDAVWLATAADILYRPQLGALLLDRFKVGPAALFYLLYAAGVVRFAVLPALAAGRWNSALVNGALLGLLAYGTYDLTNQATLKGWSAVVTVADLCWGACLTGVSASLAYGAARLITRISV